MDKALVDAMRAGKTVMVKGTSSRGTETTDSFSLGGFTKAYAEIGKACGIK
jgi:invasion protein IalB